MYIRTSKKTDKCGNKIRTVLHPHLGTNRVLIACDDDDNEVGFAHATLSGNDVSVHYLVVTGAAALYKTDVNTVVSVSSALLTELVNSNRCCDINIRSCAEEFIPTLTALGFNRADTDNELFVRAAESDMSVTSVYHPFVITAEDDSADSELKKGVDIEKEHADTYAWIKDTYEKTGKWPEDIDVFSHIAGDHIKEFDTYYTDILIPGEEKAKSKKTDTKKEANGTDLMYDY